MSDEARRQSPGRLHLLGVRATSEVPAELPEQMLRVQQSVNGAAQAVASRYFQAGPLPTWTE